MNLRPSGYEPDELPDCSTPRYKWCLEPESNRHGTKYHRILSPVRLPIPPSRHLYTFAVPLRTLTMISYMLYYVKLFFGFFQKYFFIFIFLLFSISFIKSSGLLIIASFFFFIYFFISLSKLHAIDLESHKNTLSIFITL